MMFKIYTYVYAFCIFLESHSVAQAGLSFKSFLFPLPSARIIGMYHHGLVILGTL